MEIEILLDLYELAKKYPDRIYTFRELAKELGFDPSTGYVYRNKELRDLILSCLDVVDSGRVEVYRINKEKVIRRLLSIPLVRKIVDIVANL